MIVSRGDQGEVSTRLASQAMGALWELLRGFQAADEQVSGRLLATLADEEPDCVYGGFLTVLLRLVFLLYAEDTGLIPADEIHDNGHSVTGLYRRLCTEYGYWPDTMDQRYGAWASLVSLFRLVHDGGGHGAMSLPARHGQLFDPNGYPFLGAAAPGGEWPRVSDGCIYRVLDALLMLDGERLSYAALDVEQLGSVYEAMIGFAVEKARGPSIAVRADGQKSGAMRADRVVDLDALLAVPPAARKKWLAQSAGCHLQPKDAAALQAATTVEEAVAALGRHVSRYTPNCVPPGALYLQPTEERRRSGSHYTPRELTGPIVRTTLQPVLEALGPKPTPEQILELKICDPAMGSGAFLVEACRQLADILLEAWQVHHRMIPDDEAPLLHARRLVAQRCLYGVDKNPFAVNLARVSLWLVTLARDHAFTFVNHALKAGDSLVGLTRGRAETGGSQSEEEARALSPFQWAIEFPEVFNRERSGFDAIVGNPPFLGGTMISTRLGGPYLAYLTRQYKGSGNRMDLVAYFFRRAFDLLAPGGAFGLIATNTIGQGDTRTGGLCAIVRSGGCIFAANPRVSWPGVAAVVVSIIHASKAPLAGPFKLGKRMVRRISAFLVDGDQDETPAALAANKGLSFSGSKPYGQGFLFDDRDPAANPLRLKDEVVEKNPRNAERIFPYIGGEEVNSHPRHAHSRYVIDFGSLELEECRRWPELLAIAELRVRPERERASREVAGWAWWRFWRSRADLVAAIQTLPRVLVNSQVSAHLAFAFQPTHRVFAHTLNIFSVSTFAAFCTLQSRFHEIWARFFSSSMKDDMRYTPSDCFETFPFPPGWQSDSRLEQAGKACYEFRADLMVAHDEGLTRTYNRFHDPDEASPDITRLRELHAAMDRAVLDAYGWSDIPTDCAFLLDYEIDEESWGAKKKPWRYRWPDEIHDRVLGRLLDSNRVRAEEERATAGRRRPRVAPLSAGTFH